MNLFSIFSGYYINCQVGDNKGILNCRYLILCVCKMYVIIIIEEEIVNLVEKGREWEELKSKEKNDIDRMIICKVYGYIKKI